MLHSNAAKYRKNMENKTDNVFKNGLVNMNLRSEVVLHSNIHNLGEKDKVYS